MEDFNLIFGFFGLFVGLAALCWCYCANQKITRLIDKCKYQQKTIEILVQNNLTKNQQKAEILDAEVIE